MHKFIGCGKAANSYCWVVDKDVVYAPPTTGSVVVFGGLSWFAHIIATVSELLTHNIVLKEFRKIFSVELNFYSIYTRPMNTKVNFIKGLLL